MPIVPFFDRNTGASGGPQPSGSVPVWLDLPTQAVQLGTTATGSITLNTPTNGVAPFTYTVIPTTQNQNSTLTVSGNILEISNPAAMVTALASGGAHAYRVVVFDSQGNYGTGALIIWDGTLPGYSFAPIVEKVLDWDEDPNGYTFPARSHPGATGYTAYRPSGDGFSYPRPATTVEIEGARLMNTPPGGILVTAYLASFSGSAELVLLVLRRKADLTSSSWLASPDFLAWPDIAAITPTIPLGTGTTYTTRVETNTQNGKSYAAEYLAYAVTAGTAPTSEVCTVNAGVATLGTQNTVGSTRIVSLSIRPASPGVAGNAQREPSMSTAIAGMMRAKVKVTLTGDYSYAELRWGFSQVASSPSPIGIRIRGRQATAFTIAGQPAVQVSANLSGTLRNLGWYRRAVFDGQYIGIDCISLGGVGYFSVYPWDPLWTDFPDYPQYSFTLPIPGGVGPVPNVVSAANIATSLPYAGGTQPVGAVNNSVVSASQNWGLIATVAQGGTGSGGAEIEVARVEYFWKTMSLGPQT